MTLPVRLVARLLVAPILVVAAAILIKSYAQVGDGFSAGVVASLALVLERLARDPDRDGRPISWRGPVALGLGGLAAALGTAFVPTLVGEPIFSHTPGAGQAVTKLGTLELATPVLFDLGVAAVVVATVVLAFDLLEGQ